MAKAEQGPGPPSPAPRQTLSYLQRLFEQRGLRPKSKLGQNFLIDLNVVDLIVRAGDVTANDLVLEVGSGTGSLTTRLADLAARVVSVELDTAFYVLVEEVAGGRDNVRLIHADVLKNKNLINPIVMAALDEERARPECRHLKLVANLPYAVATPVIANFLLSALPFERMLVTVQWEIAERLMARPGTKDYGALAVLVQSLAEVELVRRLAPSVFWPRPKVSSAIVWIRPDPARRAHVGDVTRFRGFLRELYVHRRKNLRGALAGRPSGRIPKEEVDRKLAELGLAGTIRAEALDLEQHLRLCAIFA